MSLRIILNNVGPSIEPYGTPDKIFKKSMQMLLTLTHFLRFLKWLFRKVNFSKLNPQACNLAINRSFRIQSNAFDKSIEAAPVNKLLSNTAFQFSISLKST